MGVGIVATGSYLPMSVLGNAELAARIKVDTDWIVQKTGIRERRIAAPGDATSDLAARAGKRALRSAGIAATDLDVVIVATGTGDQPSPATACYVQAKLRASNAVAFDVMAVCSGFIYGLTIARDMLFADQSRKYALVVGAEVYSRFVDYQQKGASALLGDGAGAVIVGRTESGGILASRLVTDGTLAHLGGIAGGGSRHPASPATLSSGMHYVTMDGRTIREMVASLLPGLVTALTDLLAIKLSDLNLIVPHQANGTMLKEWVQLLDIDPEITHETVTRYGNTGAASIPITLDDAVQCGRLSPGDRILSISFGAGVAWGGVIVEWEQ
ncbi:3-oxoacyl-ACP synthase III family protein [Haloechinothrix halophila]|uniref:3-oxoacyl-ACP synthase III family protein n=1 Tax=Haloechinothrix halophila TaxID=1069073 RepID=UPI00040E892C|nr:beta-ketoacyl-ACP synthase 3 [Haloechinothrix halophila]